MVAGNHYRVSAACPNTLEEAEDRAFRPSRGSAGIEDVAGNQKQIYGFAFHVVRHMIQTGFQLVKPTDVLPNTACVPIACVYDLHFATSVFHPRE
jgi:hypothetical protein